MHSLINSHNLKVLKQVKTSKVLLTMWNHISILLTSIMVLFFVQIPPNKQHDVMQFYKLQNDNLPLLSCVFITLCMAPAGVLRSIAHSSVTSHSSPDPSPSPSVSTFSCKTKYQTTEGKISTRYKHTPTTVLVQPPETSTIQSKLANGPVRSYQNKLQSTGKNYVVHCSINNPNKQDIASVDSQSSKGEDSVFWDVMQWLLVPWKWKHYDTNDRNHSTINAASQPRLPEA